MKKWIVLFLVLIAAAISIFVYVSTGSEKPFYNDINLTQYQKEVDSKNLNLFMFMRQVVLLVKK